jgi:hypothetical protein
VPDTALPSPGASFARPFPYSRASFKRPHPFPGTRSS